jgi:hypothetical protein
MYFTIFLGTFDFFRSLFSPGAFRAASILTIMGAPGPCLWDVGKHKPASACIHGGSRGLQAPEEEKPQGSRASAPEFLSSLNPHNRGCPILAPLGWESTNPHRPVFTEGAGAFRPLKKKSHKEAGLQPRSFSSASIRTTMGAPS